MGKTRKPEPSPQNQRRRRTPTPQHSILRFSKCIPPNDQHPLARISPEQRGEKRCELIAALLARLAQATTKKGKTTFSDRPAKGTMKHSSARDSD